MYTILLLTFAVSIFSMFATIYLQDGTIIVTLLPCIFAECGVATGFYFWLRKIRSLIEMKQEFGEQFIENTVDDV